MSAEHPRSPEHDEFLPEELIKFDLGPMTWQKAAEKLSSLALVDARRRTVFRLREGTIRVGRHADCELILTSDTVSRRHAEIIVSKGQVQIHDLGSRNGTFINDKYVEVGRALIGDWIRFGGYSLQLQTLDVRDLEEDLPDGNALDLDDDTRNFVAASP